jgi:A/G-specific adenine glycosylase
MTQSEQIQAFRDEIWAFYGHSGRSFAWRKTKNPYRILVSEVMLQQTQTSRVAKKYPEFLRTFPTVKALADASLADVLAVWQGMGYNRRARYLREAAQKIIREHKGRVPKTEVGLSALPGIGHYTANAILAFAHNEPRIFIETNIRRVFIHYFFGDRREVNDKEILLLVEATLDTKNPREWYYALMDYGAQLPKLARKNSNIQSKHYAKQSKFKGSLRELRGKIVRSLGEKPQTLASLKKACDNDARTKEALDL